MQYITALFSMLLVSCAGAGSGGGIGGSGGTDAATETRTVCVPSGDAVLADVAARAVDAWNMGEETEGSLWPECPPYARCLGLVVAHELGHALGIQHHTPHGLMAWDIVRTDLRVITAGDYAALPASTPWLQFVEGAACDHPVAWGYPAEAVLATEVAWYEIKTRRVWIDPEPLYGPWSY